MPVDHDLPVEGMIYQREQYAKGGVGRRYWDYRDAAMLSRITTEKRIVDIGCGEGITLERLVRRFPDRTVFGIDRCAENVEICRRHHLPVLLGSVYHLCLSSESVDCCLFTEVIEHLDHPGRALDEIARVLDKNGLLLLLFPNDKVFKLARLATFKFREAFYDPGHVKQWSPKEMVAELESRGFRLLAAENLPFYFWRLSLHHLVAARKS